MGEWELGLDIQVRDYPLNVVSEWEVVGIQGGFHSTSQPVCMTLYESACVYVFHSMSQPVLFHSMSQPVCMCSTV